MIPQIRTPSKKFTDFHHDNLSRHTNPRRTNQEPGKPAKKKQRGSTGDYDMNPNRRSQERDRYLPKNLATEGGREGPGGLGMKRRTRKISPAKNPSSVYIEAGGGWAGN